MKATDSYIPRPSINPVFRRLLELKLVQRHSNDEVELQCPNCGGVGVYRFPSRQTPLIGDFECLGCNLSTENFLDCLAVTPFLADWRPKLIIKPGELLYEVVVIKEHLAKSNCVFRHEGRLIKIDDKGDSVEICELSNENLLLIIPEFVALYQRDNRMSGELKLKPIDLSEKLSKAILSFAGDDAIPKLRALVEFPVVDEFGKILCFRGFDSASGLWMSINMSDYEELPITVSRKQAEVACSNLQAVFRGVSFAAPCDEMAAISALFTVVLKWKLSTVPLIHVVATKPGTGKSTLTRAIGGLASQSTPMYLSYPKSEEEMTKTLFSTLRLEPKIVIFDNITSPLIPFADFCTCLTEGRFSSRVLGTSNVVEVANHTIFLSNGNRQLPLADLIRRTLVVRLDCQSFRNVERDASLEQIFSKHRNEIVRDVLTIYRAWVLAGSPVFDNFESFEDWNRCCRSPLLWLNRADPLEQTKLLLDRENRPNVSERVVEIFKNNFGKSSFRVSDIYRWLELEENSSEESDCLDGDRAELRTIFKEWEVIDSLGSFNSRRCGRVLLKLVGGGGELRLVVDPKATPRLFKVEGEK